MHYLLKYNKRLADFFDISPFENSGITKLLVYTLWGINVLLFLGKDISFTEVSFNSGINSGQTIQCTVLKKVSTTDLYIEYFTFVKISNIVVILPYDYELPIPDVITLPKGRSPPSLLFS